MSLVWKKMSWFLYITTRQHTEAAIEQQLVKNGRWCPAAKHNVSTLSLSCHFPCDNQKHASISPSSCHFLPVAEIICHLS